MRTTRAEPKAPLGHLWRVTQRLVPLHEVDITRVAEVPLAQSYRDARSGTPR